MKVEVSIGEAIDKLSILELKYKKITDDEKRIEIQKEIVVLTDFNQYKINYSFNYALLMYVNEKIWDMTDIIKKINIKNDTLQFAELSNQIFEFNQKRFRIKNWFNLLTNSIIKEQKSYASSYCKIDIDTEDTLYSKLAEINYLLLEYDIVIFDASFNSTIQSIFKVPTIIYDQIIIDDLKIQPKIVNLSEFNMPSLINSSIFEFTPIKYIASGLLGDFVQSLSIINETFYTTGKKGILYIAETGDKFRNGLVNTFNDTYPLLITQKYICDYKIYTNEQFDIDLTLWRHSPSLYIENWYYIYKATYNIEWGKHKWITTQIDEKWTDKVLINTTEYRWCYNIDFKLLHEQYGDKLIYISADESQYNYFIQSSSLINIPFYKINNFNELCTIINSCKLFVGSLSAPLTIAHAVDVPRICGIFDPHTGHHTNGDNILNQNLNCIWNNIRYSV